MKILGWYSLIVLVLSAIANIADDDASSGLRIGRALVIIPIIIYTALNIF